MLETHWDTGLFHISCVIRRARVGVRERVRERQERKGLNQI